MKLTDAFAEEECVVTGEVGPPKGAGAEGCLEAAGEMNGAVDAVNVTDNQSAVVRLGSLAVSRLLKESGIEPVYQLTGRDRNRIALQSDLLSAFALGIENVLLLTGDHMVLGDHPEAKGVFDLDSVQLIRAARELNEGRDLAGHELDEPTDFCIGAVVNPGSDNLSMQVIKMKKKIDAGARFLQTQAIYAPEVFERFLDEAGPTDVPIMAGIVPLKSAGMARYMNDNVAGIHVPDNLIGRLKDVAKEDRRKVSLEISLELVEEIRDICDGIHIMPLGWDDLVPQIVDGAGLRSERAESTTATREAPQQPSE